VVQGREAGQVKAGLVRLESEKSRRASFSWAMASSAILSNSYDRALGYPDYITLTVAPECLYDLEIIVKALFRVVLEWLRH
jgi:hypothetical protein